MINVRPYALEVLPDYASLFTGVFLVELGSAPTVGFVPSVLRRADAWPPSLPADPDRPQNLEEARRLILATHTLSVTPDDQRAGTSERLPPLDLDMPSPEIFYVSTRDFDIYEHELAAVAELTPFVTSGVPVSEVADLRFVRFLFDRVLRDSAHAGRI